MEIYSSSYLHFAPGLSDNAAFNLKKMPSNAYLGLYLDSEGPSGVIKDLPPELRVESTATAAQSWIAALEQEVANSLNRGETGLIDVLGPQFEKALILKALNAVSQGYVTAKDFVNRVEPLTNLLDVMQHLMSHNGHLKTAIIP